MEKVQIRLDSDTIAALDKEARKLQISRAELIRRCVERNMLSHQAAAPVIELKTFQATVAAVYREAAGALRHADAEHLTSLVINRIFNEQKVDAGRAA